MIPENIKFVELVDKYHYLMMDGWGGINSDTIRLIIEVEDVDDIEIFIEKVSIYYSNLKMFSNEG